MQCDSHEIVSVPFTPENIPVKLLPCSVNTLFTGKFMEGTKNGPGG
jgi:DNA-binding helix-hairpin-helix protein with protein kinase domain